MAWGSRGTKLCLATLMLLAICAGARAEPDASPYRYLMFSGGELWKMGNFLHAGMVWAPDGLGADGFALKLLSGAGRYRYWSGATAVTGQALTVSAMPGWRIKQGRLEATVYAGLDLQRHWFRPNDVENDLRGLHLGVRVTGEAWYEPSNSTMMQGWATWSSIGSGYSIRGATGWRLLDWCYVGPEAQALGDGNYRQLRAGLHVTAWHTGAFEWSAALGYASDQSHGGIYVRLGVLTRQ